MAHFRTTDTVKVVMTCSCLIPTRAMMSSLQEILHQEEEFVVEVRITET